MKINLNLKKKSSITGFNEETPESVYNEFREVSRWGYDYEMTPLPEHLKILYADYTYEDYSGDAYVLGYNTEKRQWFEVHGGHCSCYGLEGQWEEEYYDSKEQLMSVIERRLAVSDCYYRYAYSSKEFKKWLEE